MVRRVGALLRVGQGRVFQPEASCAQGLSSRCPRDRRCPADPRGQHVLSTQVINEPTIPAPSAIIGCPCAQPSCPAVPLLPTQIIRNKAQKGQLPPLSEYLEAARQRLRELAGLPDGDPGGYQTT